MNLYKATVKNYANDVNGTLSTEWCVAGTFKLAVETIAEYLHDTEEIVEVMQYNCDKDDVWIGEE